MRTRSSQSAEDLNDGTQPADIVWRINDTDAWLQKLCSVALDFGDALAVLASAESTFRIMMPASSAVDQC